MPSARGFAAIVSAAIVAACSSGADPAATLETMPSTPELGEPLFVTDIDEAVALNLASNGADPPVLAWTTRDQVVAAGLDTSLGRLLDVRAISGAAHPVAHPIERPAVRVSQDGEVVVAFPGHDGDGLSIFALSGPDEPRVVSGPPHHETVLVHMASTPQDDTVMSWLEDATLSVALPGVEGPVEIEEVDDQTCDCCNPVPLFLDTTLVIAYRDYDTLGGRVVRDVVAVRSEDGGISFEPPSAVADDHWYIDACPFSGPSVVEVDGALVVAWMDARQSLHPDQEATTIWVDRSSDGGASFGADLAVTDGGIHRWPVMAVDGSRNIHLVWETQGGEGGISHATSSDGGLTFGPPLRLMGRSSDDAGSPGSPSVIVHQDKLVVTWADPAQGHVAAWRLP